jgi:hypothetical protein
VRNRAVLHAAVAAFSHTSVRGANCATAFAVAHRSRPSTVIPAKAGTQSTVSTMNDAPASPVVANAARAVSLRLVWVPAGSASLRTPG